jgi:hypothetical protein
MTQAFPSADILMSAGPNRTIDAEWVLVGWREKGRCRMLASESIDHATLTFARIRQEFEFRDAATMRTLGIKAARHLNADILSYVLIEADSYAECLAALLFGYQWKPDTARMLRNPEGMGRNAGPVRHDEAPNPVELCQHRPAGTQVMFCDRPAGHFPATPHGHTIEWTEDDERPRPAIGNEARP